MPIDYNEISPTLRSIYSNFNGSNVAFGQQLLFKQMKNAADISLSFGNVKSLMQLIEQIRQLLQIKNLNNMQLYGAPVQNLGIGGAIGGLIGGGGGGGIMGAASGVLDMASGLIKDRPEYSGKHGKITKTMDAAYDATMKAVGMVPGFGLIASLAMGAGKLLNKAVGRLGGGTDGMTKADAILGSNFLGLTPIGLINGFGGKKANTYTRNEELDKSTNGGFSGFLTTQTGTEEGAGKKFGLFSRSAMNKQNELTEFTTNMKHTISGVVDTNTLNNMAAQGSIPFLAQQQQVDLSGGIQQMRAARQGMQFSRRVVSKYQTGKKLKRSVQTIDIATGKYVEVPIDLTKEQIQGKVPIRLSNGTAVFMNKDGTVSSERWETIGEREHVTPKGQSGLKMYPINHTLLPLVEVTPNPYVEQFILEFPMYKSLDFAFVPDDTFTRLKTGAGDIEYFDAEEPLITYVNGYTERHPHPGSMVVLYNPDRNSYQDVKMDMLFHSLRDIDPEYLSLIQPLADNTLKTKGGDIWYGANKSREADLEKYGKADPIESYVNNTIDGILRNLYFKGTSEELRDRNYLDDLDLLLRNLQDYWPVLKQVDQYLRNKFPNGDLVSISDKIASMNNIAIGDKIKHPDTGITLKYIGNQKTPKGESVNFVDENGDGYYIPEYQKGGQMNVIPEGALHARLHHLDLIDPDLAKEVTNKGIPVITVEKDGEIVQHAEIEHSEIIFTLEVTNKIEDLRKKYHEDKKDEYAILAGKILVTEILHNTDDRTNLIDSIE